MDSRKEGNSRSTTTSNTLINSGLLSDSKLEDNQKLTRSVTEEPVPEDIQEAAELQYERAERLANPGFLSRLFWCFFTPSKEELEDISFAEPLPNYMRNKK